MKIRPISISLSPNIEKDDILITFKTLFNPFNWKKGKEIKILEEEFKEYFNVNYSFSFNSGRSSLFAILKSLNLNNNDEVLIQAFTCNAVSNPIIWNKLKPVFVDIGINDFNIDIFDLEKKITKRSKVIIVQHTFGLPANIEKILEISKKYNLVLIEDCAHSLGAKYKEKLVGTFGDFSFFSFSRDKVISSIYGGMVIVNNEKYANNFKKTRDSLSFPSYYFIFQQLIHPILLNFIILPTYNFFNFGKIILVLFQNFKILSKAVHIKEKRGEIPNYFPRKMPNGLAIIALNQFRKIEKFNNHRKKIANIYYEKLKDTPFVLPAEFQERENIFLRFTLRHINAHNIIKNAWNKENILIGDWYTSPVAPNDTKKEKIGYFGDCKNAEILSKETFNLPTHINIKEKETEEIINFLKKNI